jgi:hypothetical protein
MKCTISWAVTLCSLVEAVRSSETSHSRRRYPFVGKAKLYLCLRSWPEGMLQYDRHDSSRVFRPELSVEQ